MSSGYMCTKKGYCPGQTARGRCLVRGHLERKECEHLKVKHGFAKLEGPIPKLRSPVKDPDTSFYPGTSLWVVQELMKERRTWPAAKPAPTPPQ